VAEPFRFDRAFTLPVPPAELWSVLSVTADYPRWWPWLRVLDAAGLQPGTTAHLEIRSPLPYRLRCDVHVDRVEPGRSLDATVSGDLVGPAGLRITPARQGSRARLAWALELRAPLLSRLVPVTRPAMAWAHDVIVTAGLDQFRRRALRDRAARSTFVAVPPKQKSCPGG
jgi:uncharacterized protein YndB with AHSA1/START domain